MIFAGLVFVLLLIETGLRATGYIYHYTQNNRNRAFSPDEDPFTIICLGESTTAFGGEYSWPRQLESILNEQVETGCAGFRVVNKGIPGGNTDYLMSELPNNLKEYDPDMIITMMGANDWLLTAEYPESSIPQHGFLRSLKITKLIRLLHLNLLNKFRDKGLYTPPENTASNAPGENYRNAPFPVEKVTPDFSTSAAAAHEAERVAASGRYAEAEQLFKKAIQEHPEDISPIMNLAKLYEQQQLYVEAERYFRIALTLRPGDERLLFHLGRIYRQLEDYENAEFYFRKVLDTNAGHRPVYASFGKILDYLGKDAEAEWMFRMAIKLNPGDRRGYIGFSDFLERRGRHGELEKMMISAVENNPASDYIAGRLARFYMNRGNVDSASKYFRKIENLRMARYNPVTRRNYINLKKIARERGVRLVCSQYPGRSVDYLKKMFDTTDGVVFVSNEKTFTEALESGSFAECFSDNCYGDFGHCTPKGNRLLAGNVAKILNRAVFNRTGG